MSYEIKYRFDLGERVFFFDQQLGGFSRGTVRQVEIDTALENLIITDFIKYTVYMTNGSNKVLDESVCFTEVSPPSSPGVPDNSLTVEYKPGDYVYVTDADENTIFYARVAQIEVNIYENTTLVYYWVNKETDDCTRNESSIRVPANTLFATANDAWVDLGIIQETPTPTPTLTPTPTVTPTPTPSATPTSSGGGGNDNSPTPFYASKMNMNASTITRGMAVYVTNLGGVDLVNTDATTLNFLGFVLDDSIPPLGVGRIIMEGTINNIDSVWNDLIAENGLLQTGKRYYIAANGRISAYPPSSGYVRQVGFAVSPNILDIRILPSVKLTT